MALDIESLTPSLENAHKHFPPTDIGPIWQTDEHGDFLLPERTLGWEIIGWAETKLRAFQGDGPLRLTDEQCRMILWFYALDERGRFLYRRAVWQAFKGAGKGPFAAVLCLVEFLGPSQFSHWDPYTGEPVGKRNENAWVQILAVSKDQTKNVFALLPVLITDELKAEHNLDVQRELIYAYGGRNRLESVGSSFRSMEGGRATFGVADETQHWTPTNGGHDLYKTLRGNLTKTGGRLFMTTNAHTPGEESIAQIVREAEEAVWDGAARPTGTLYMSREAHPDAPFTAEWLPFIIDTLIGDAWWARENINEIVRDAMDTTYTVSQSKKMFLNRVITADDAFLSEGELMACLEKGLTGSEMDLEPGDEIVLGFDGGKTEDATALVAIRIRDRLIVPIMVEEKPLGPLGENWRVEQQHVDEVVNRTFARYDVKAFFADVELWESYISLWSERHGHRLLVRSSEASAIGWDMRGSKERVARTWEAYRQAFVDQQLKWNGSGFFRRHALNAKLGHNGKGLIARKEKPNSKRKIDCFVAAYVAYAALQKYIERTNRPEKPKKVSRPAPVYSGDF